jgi:hypothetical protein
METPRFDQIALDSEPFQIYTGDEAGCRCGCHGRYFEPGSKGYTRAWNKFRRLNPIVMMPTPQENINLILASEHRGSAVSNSVYSENDTEIWFDLWLPNDKTITLYFKKNV